MQGRHGTRHIALVFYCVVFLLDTLSLRWTASCLSDWKERHAWSGIPTSCRRARYAHSQLRDGRCHSASGVAAAPSATRATMIERGAAAQFGAVEVCGCDFPGCLGMLAASGALGPRTCSRAWGTGGWATSSPSPAPRLWPLVIRSVSCIFCLRLCYCPQRC